MQIRPQAASPEEHSILPPKLTSLLCVLILALTLKARSTSGAQRRERSPLRCLTDLKEAKDARFLSSPHSKPTSLIRRVDRIIWKKLTIVTIDGLQLRVDLPGKFHLCEDAKHTHTSTLLSTLHVVINQLCDIFNTVLSRLFVLDGFIQL